MDSDDDYQSFSPRKEPSPPPLNLRRLKRLKKSSPKPLEDNFSESIDPLFFQVDFAKLEALENDSEPQYFDESNSLEEASLSQESLSQGTENDDKMELGSDVEVPKAKRVLEFDAEVVGGVVENGKTIGEDSEGFDLEKSENGKNDTGGLFDEKMDKEKKKKEKREKSESGDDLKTKERRSNKKREEKVSVSRLLSNFDMILFGGYVSQLMV